MMLCYFPEICNKVYLIHRRAEFRGAASTLEKLEQKENVEIIRNAKVQEITGDEENRKCFCWIREQCIEISRAFSRQSA